MKPGCNGVPNKDHNYEPRYDSKLSSHYKPAQPTNIWATFTSDEIPFDEIYVHDICTQCGNVIKRS